MTNNNWVLLSHSMNGSFEAGAGSDNGGSAIFSFQLEFRIFEKEWTVVPLIDSQLITDGWTVRLVNEHDALHKGSLMLLRH